MLSSCDCSYAILFRVYLTPPTRFVAGTGGNGRRGRVIRVFFCCRVVMNVCMNAVGG